MGTMKKFLTILISLLIFVFIGAAGVFFYVKAQPVPVVEIGTVDLKTVRDGSYTGEYEEGLVKVIVKVDVVSSHINTVKIERHECGLGKKAEEITKEVEKSQSLNVDIVSGATLSSRVILKAVEVALEKGKR